MRLETRTSISIAFLDSCQILRLLSDEHRVRIRQRCLFFLDEEDETVRSFFLILLILPYLDE